MSHRFHFHQFSLSLPRHIPPPTHTHKTSHKDSFPSVTASGCKAHQTIAPGGQGLHWPFSLHIPSTWHTQHVLSKCWLKTELREHNGFTPGSLRAISITHACIHRPHTHSVYICAHTGVFLHMCEHAPCARTCLPVSILSRQSIPGPESFTRGHLKPL